MPRTNRDTFDPREVAGLISAVPKRNLERVQHNYGSQGSFAQELSRCAGETINRQTVNEWIRGKVRMSNKSVILVSHVLGVSPLYILDLCQREDGSDGMDAGVERPIIAAKTEYLLAWRQGGTKPVAVNDVLRVIQFPATAEELEAELTKLSGDHRDLHRLACDAADWYVRRCRYVNVGTLLSRIVESGRVCVP